MEFSVGFRLSFSPPCSLGRIFQGFKPPRQITRRDSQQLLLGTGLRSSTNFTTASLRDYSTETGGRIIVYIFCLLVFLLVYWTAIMEGRPISRIFKAALVTDSTGKNMESLFNQNMEATVQFTVYYYSGAGLRSLWETIEHIILFHHVNIVYLLGGICDLTDRSYDDLGRRQFWPPTNIRGRFSFTRSILSDNTSNFTLMYIKTKFCIIPDPGCDLIRYNSVTNPVPRYLLEIQEKFDNGIYFLRELTKSLNESINMITQWTIDVTHGRRYGKSVPDY